jgi:hypothetical protein
MVATFNGWEDMPEQEREALERWEEEQQRGDQSDHCESGVLTTRTPLHIYKG